MQYSKEIITNIEDIGAEVWNKLSFDKNLVLDYLWFKSNEKALSNVVYYITLKKCNDVIAILPVYEIDPPMIWSYSNPYKFLNLEMYDDIMDKPQIQYNITENNKYFLITSPFGYESQILIEPSLTISEKEIIYQQMLVSVEELMKEVSISEVFFLYTKPSTSTYRHLQSHSYLHLPIFCDCLIDIDYSNFDQYLKMFTYKDSLKIRSEINNFKQSGLTIEVCIDFEQYVKRLAELEGKLLQKYSYTDEQIDLEYSQKWYSDLNKYYGNNSYIFIAKDANEQLVGFTLFIKKNGTAFAKAAGFDYNLLPPKSYCYFNVVYYYPIQHAIKNGISKINYGGSLYEAKQRRGCYLDKLYLSYKSLNTSSMSYMRETNKYLENAYEKYFKKITRGADDDKN